MAQIVQGSTMMKRGHPVIVLFFVIRCDDGGVKMG